MDENVGYRRLMSLSREPRVSNDSIKISGEDSRVNLLMFFLLVTKLWKGHEIPDAWIWIRTVQSLKPGLLSKKDMTHSLEQILVGGAPAPNEVNPSLVRPIAMPNQLGEITHMVLIGRLTSGIAARSVLKPVEECTALTATRRVPLSESSP